MRKSLLLLATCVLATLLVGGLPHLVDASDIKPDEDVIIFPTQAHLDGKQKNWIVPIHGWIFERDRDSIWRSALAKVFIESLGLENDATRSELFRERVMMFLVDNERNKRLTLQFAHKYVTAGKTGPNGHFYASLRLPVITGEVSTQDNWQDISLVLPAADHRSISGKIQMLAQHGLSVISDIDDTIKQSNVLDKKQLIENTFSKPFIAVPGMAALYRQWQEQGAMFHYVSASPWQLYPALSSFFRQAGLPAGSFHLKLFRIKDETALSLFASPLETKLTTISEIINTYPQRQFILVGDSGEKDPEVYAGIYRQFPQQIAHIYIRNITHEGAGAERYQQTFKGIAQTNWTLFTNPENLPHRISIYAHN